VQASQADRIRREIDAFTARVQQHKASFASHMLFKHSTGCDAAYPMLDAAAADLAKLSKECKHFTELSSVFELSAAVVPVTEAIKELYEQLVALKDAWDCNMLCDVQFKVRHPWQAQHVLHCP
jgi:acyl transferase domain-containing protein